MIKRYPPRGRFPESLRDWVQTRGATEFQVNLRFQELGIPCPAPLAALERLAGTRPAESFFVAAAVLGAQALGPYLEGRYQAGDRNEAKLALVRRAAATAGRLHDHGLQHRDFHGGNLLLREAEGPAGCLYVIDSPRTLDRGVVGPRARAHDLADLLYSLRHALSEGELQDLFQETASGEVTAGLLRRAYDEKRRRTQRSRGRRAFVSSSRFERHEDAAYTTFHDRSLPVADVGRLRELHDQAAARGDRSLLRYGSRSVLSVQNGTRQPVLIKEYPPDRHGSGRRATAAWAGGVALMVRDVATPQPLALLRARDHRSSYLMTETLEDAVPLHLLASRGEPDPEPRRRVARAVRRTLERLIRTETVHTDLSPKNVLVRTRGPEVEVYLVDWDAVRPGRRWTPRRLVRALTQLGDVPSCVFSRVDRLRFVQDLIHATDLKLDVATLLRDSERRLRRRRHIPEVRVP